jgi:hypothetical protein
MIPRCRLVAFTRDRRAFEILEPRTPRKAYRRAVVLLRTDAAVVQVKIETLSARLVARLYRS